MGRFLTFVLPTLYRVADYKLEWVEPQTGTPGPGIESPHRSEPTPLSLTAEVAPQWPRYLPCSEATPETEPYLRELRPAVQPPAAPAGIKPSNFH